MPHKFMYCNYYLTTGLFQQYLDEMILASSMKPLTHLLSFHNCLSGYHNSEAGNVLVVSISESLSEKREIDEKLM